MKTDTETLIKTMRILAQEIDSEDGVANIAIGEAADRLEELQLELTETREELDYERMQVKNLRNSGVLALHERDKAIERAEKAYKLRKEAEIERDSVRDTMSLNTLELTQQRDEARAEVERLKVTVNQQLTCPEPSRLEIATLLYAASIQAGLIDVGLDPDMSPHDAFTHADAIIAAAKEGAK